MYQKTAPALSLGSWLEKPVKIQVLLPMPAVVDRPLLIIFLLQKQLLLRWTGLFFHIGCILSHVGKTVLFINTIFSKTHFIVT